MHYINEVKKSHGSRKNHQKTEDNKSTYGWFAVNRIFHGHLYIFIYLDLNFTIFSRTKDESR